MHPIKSCCTVSAQRPLCVNMIRERCNKDTTDVKHETQKVCGKYNTVSSEKVWQKLWPKPHLSPDTVVPQRARPRVTVFRLGRFDSLITIAVAASISILTDHHSPLEASRTGTGTLQSTCFYDDLNIWKLWEKNLSRRRHCPFKYLYNIY